MVAALDTLGAPPVFRANCSIPKVSMFHHSPATIKEHQDQLSFCCLMFMSGHVGAFAKASRIKQSRAGYTEDCS